MTQRTCSIDGCDRPYWAKAMCRLHYRRSREGTPLDAPIRTVSAPYAGTQCSIEDCSATPVATGMCGLHYRRWKKRGDPLVTLINRDYQYLSPKETLAALSVPASNGCIEWQGYASASGYGQMMRDGVKLYVHRYAYEQAHGPIPEGLVVRHTCDNRPCVNPDHLLIGTGRDNAMDAYERERHRHGIAHHAAKMTPESVRELRALRASGMYYQQLADRFGLSYVQARAIARREAWRHVA